MSGAGISRRQNIGRLNNYLFIMVDFTSNTWNTVGTHEILTVTGLIRLQLVPECTGDLTGGGTIQLGTEINTDSFIAATTPANIDNGKLWLSTTPVTEYITSSASIDRTLNGADVGYQIVSSALTGGSITFHCWWEPMNENSPGTVVAGSGGTL